MSNCFFDFDLFCRAMKIAVQNAVTISPLFINVAVNSEIRHEGVIRGEVVLSKTL